MKPDTQERPETKTFICPSCKRYYIEPLPVQCACGQTSRFFQETHPSNDVRAENKERSDFEKIKNDVSIKHFDIPYDRLYLIRNQLKVLEESVVVYQDVSRKEMEELSDEMDTMQSALLSRQDQLIDARKRIEELEALLKSDSKLMRFHKWMIQEGWYPHSSGEYFYKLEYRSQWPPKEDNAKKEKELIDIFNNL